MEQEVTQFDANGDWKLTTERYVGFIDILGFRRIVYEQSHEGILSLLNDIHFNVVENSSIKDAKTFHEYIRFTIYTDTVTFCSKDDSDTSLNLMILTLGSLSQNMFINKIPHKGALSFGKMTMDFSRYIFWGKPLIDCNLLLDEILFYGIIIHGNAEKKLAQSSYINKSIFRLYDCPLKNGIVKHYTIPPIALTNCKEYITQIKWDGILNEIKEIHQSIIELRYSTSGHLRIYIDNTDNYLATICEEYKVLRNV